MAKDLSTAPLPTGTRQTTVNGVARAPAPGEPAADENLIRARLALLTVPDAPGEVGADAAGAAAAVSASLATVATTGQYSDLVGAPTGGTAVALATTTTAGTIYLGDGATSRLHKVGSSGAYADLIGAPAVATNTSAPLNQLSPVILNPDPSVPCDVNTSPAGVLGVGQFVRQAGYVSALHVELASAPTGSAYTVLLADLVSGAIYGSATVPAGQTSVEVPTMATSIPAGTRVVFKRVSVGSTVPATVDLVTFETSPFVPSGATAIGPIVAANPPSLGAATVTSGSVTIPITAPTSNGGSPVTTYEVWRAPDATTATALIATIPGSSTSYVDSSAPQGSPQYTMRARSGFDTLVSANSNTVTASVTAPAPVGSGTGATYAAFPTGTTQPSLIMFPDDYTGTAGTSSIRLNDRVAARVFAPLASDTVWASLKADGVSAGRPSLQIPQNASFLAPLSVPGVNFAFVAAVKFNALVGSLKFAYASDAAGAGVAGSALIITSGSGDGAAAGVGGVSRPTMYGVFTAGAWRVIAGGIRADKTMVVSSAGHTDATAAGTFTAVTEPDLAIGAGAGSYELGGLLTFPAADSATVQAGMQYLRDRLAIPGA